MDNKYNISNIDWLKLCLNIDEEFIYKKFPDRRDNIYANSVKDIKPNYKYQKINLANIFDSSYYKTPSEKYYGINFSKIKKNYLEFRYIGGQGYENKIQNVFECQEMFCRTIDSIIISPEFTDNEILTLKSILKSYEKISSAFNDLNLFILYFPKIVVTVDLNSAYDIVNSYWKFISSKLFRLITDGNLTKGHFNYDSDLSQFQLKSGKVKSKSLNNILFYKCELSGFFKDCEFYDCDIKNANLKNCRLKRYTKISSSVLKDVETEISIEIDDCYIYNKKDILYGTISNSIISKGDISISTTLKNTEVIT